MQSSLLDKRNERRTKEQMRGLAFWSSLVVYLRNDAGEREIALPDAVQEWLMSFMEGRVGNMNTDPPKVHLVKHALYSLVGRVSPSYMAHDAWSRRLFYIASIWCSMSNEYCLASFSLHPHACPQGTDSKALAFCLYPWCVELSDPAGHFDIIS